MKEKKLVPIRDFVEELITRIDEKKTIDCCKEEIKDFARFVRDKIGDEEIEINWKD